MYKFLKSTDCTCTNIDTCTCETEECGCKLELATKCVRYTGTTLPCLDIVEGEHLENILKKIDEKICENFDQEKEPFSTDCIEYKGEDIECDEVVVIPTNTNLDTIINYFNNKICAAEAIEGQLNIKLSKIEIAPFFWTNETCTRCDS